MLFRTPVFINNFNLSNLPGVAVYNHNFITTPSRNLNRAKLARADRSLLTSAEYTEKTITIEGIVAGSNKNDTELKFETLKGVLQIPESIIRVEQGGLQVEYTGTMNGVTQEYMGRHLKFVISMLCSNPIGRSRLTTTLLTASNENPTYTHSLNVEGSYKALPIIKVTLSSLVDASPNKKIQVLNADTTQGISVTRNWSNGDILTVDSFNKLVEVNDSGVDYDGVFPTFFPGLRSFEYIDDFTDRVADIEITYNKQFA